MNFKSGQKAACAVLLSSFALINFATSARSACCYFAAKDKDINQPGQKAFINWNPKEKLEAFTVQAKFEGNAVDFGMVIPTPSRPKLDEMPRDFFKDLAIYTILMPLPQPIYTQIDDRMYMAKKMSRASFGAPGVLMEHMRNGSVKVLEAGGVGSLDYKIIVASDASGLFEWLKSNKYTYGGDRATLDHYIQKKWFFTVMKIDPKQMKKNPDGSYLGEVTPTRFTFSTEKCIYPVKITQISVKDKTDALFYVQAPGQMDLKDDWSWMHSYRTMWLTYMLGCCADQRQQDELQTRNTWLQAKRSKDPSFETTKLEWARKLGKAEMSVLESPLANYGQMGTGDLPSGARSIAVDAFIKELESAYAKKGIKIDENVKTEFAHMSDRYQPSKGIIVKNNLDSNKSGYSRFMSTQYSFYPAREVPQDEVKTLTRLKGHLQEGMWITKFRKIMRKDEMENDLVLAEVPKQLEQTYIRIMPTSPP